MGANAATERISCLLELPATMADIHATTIVVFIAAGCQLVQLLRSTRPEDGGEKCVIVAEPGSHLWVSGILRTSMFRDASKMMQREMKIMKARRKAQGLALGSSREQNKT